MLRHYAYHSFNNVDFLYGGKVLAVCASHGIFTDKSNYNLSKIENLIITDSIPPIKLDKSQWKDKLFICRTSPLFAEAIRRTHYEGGSISELLE